MNKISELESLDRMIRAYRRANVWMLIICAAVVLSALAMGYWAFRQAAAQVFVVRDYRTERITDRKAQIDAHVRQFYNLFFAIDQNNFEQKTADALYLIGESGKQLRQRYAEANWYNQVVENNLSVSVTVDSIAVRTDTYPYEARIRAVMSVQRESSVTRRRLDAACELQDVSNSYQNPFGLLIQNFIITNNETIPEPASSVTRAH